MKKPRVFVLYDAATALDARTQARVVENVLSACRGNSVVWGLNDPELAEKFDHVVVMESGRVVEEGAYDTLKARPDSALNRLLGGA